MRKRAREREARRSGNTVTPSRRLERGGATAQLGLGASAGSGFAIGDPRSSMRLRVTVDGLADVPAEAARDRVAYPEVSPGVGWTVSASASGIEDTFQFESGPNREDVLYHVALENVAGLRLVEQTLEFLDASGDPRLRVSVPAVLDGDCNRVGATLSVEGCAVSSDPSAPWGRPVVAPGASQCDVRVSWAGKGTKYPLTLDPGWSYTNTPYGYGNYIYHSAAAVLNGDKVLLTGGVSQTAVGGAKTTLANAAILNPTTNTWTTTTQIGGGGAEDRYLHTATTLADGRVLVIGGRAADDLTQRTTAWLFDGTTWSNAGSIGAGRSVHTATLLNDGRVLVFGGQTSGNAYLNAGLVWSSAAPTTWTVSTPTVAKARFYHTATVMSDGRVLIAGGYNPTDQWLDSVEIYIPSTGLWQTPVPMHLNVPRYTHFAGKLKDGKILVAGGGYTGDLSSTEIYDPQTNQWSNVANDALATARFLPRGAVLANGKVMVVGGSNWGQPGGHTLATTEIFDPNATGARWSTGPAMIDPLAWPTTVQIGGGRLVIAHGIIDMNTSKGWSLSETLDLCADTCADGNACTADQCGTGTSCANPALASGTACDDTNVCNGRETCDGNKHCVAGVPPNLNDNRPCTADTCDPLTGPNPNLAQGTPCDDGNECTIGTTCDSNGQCVVAAPGGKFADAGARCALVNDPCVPEACSGAGTCVPTGAAIVGTSSTCFDHVCKPKTGWTMVARDAGAASGECVATPQGDAGVDPSVMTDTAALANWLKTAQQNYNPAHSPFADPARMAIISGYAKIRVPVTSDHPDGLQAAPAGLRVELLTRPNPDGGLPAAGQANNLSDYGYVLTTADGRFDLGVPGSNDYTVNLSDPSGGYLSVQRTVHVAEQDWVLLDDIVLTASVPSTTLTVNLSSGSSTWTHARGPTVLEDGYDAGAPASPDRTPTILFPPGANVTAPSGFNSTNVQVLFNEFTVDQHGRRAMPGDLPPTSQYTYAAEFRLKRVSDGVIAQDVQFDTSGAPLARTPIFYIENFPGLCRLSTPTGNCADNATTGLIGVPSGSYDRKQAGWRPEQSGRIVKILSIVGTGAQAEAQLDIDGDNDFDTTDSTFTDQGERKLLAVLYPAATNKTLWRVPMPHFTSWDTNWGFGYPADAKYPQLESNEIASVEKGDCQPGSIIECQNQVLGEDVPIAGTPFSLHYTSERQPGYRIKLRVPLTKDASTMSASLAAVGLEVSVAGRKIHSSRYLAAADALTQLAFTQPAVNATVGVSMPRGSMKLFRPGDVVTIGGVDTYEVVFVAQPFANADTHATVATLRNLGRAGSHAPGSSIPANSTLAGNKLQPNLTETVTWDRKDALGRELTGLARAHVTVSYTYFGQGAGYRDTPAFGAPAVNGGSTPMVVLGAAVERAAALITLSREVVVPLHLASAAAMGFGGWSLNVQDQFNFYAQYLAQGNGAHRVLNDKSEATLVERWRAPGASDAVHGLAFGLDGALYLAASKIGTSYGVFSAPRTPSGFGAATQIAGKNDGSGTANTPLLLPTDQAASSVAIQPRAIASGPDGAIYLADYGRSEVDKLWLDPAGTWQIRRIAGCAASESCNVAADCSGVGASCNTGTHLCVSAACVSGDADASAGVEVLANDLQFGAAAPSTDREITGLSVAPDGTVYVADRGGGSFRVRALVPKANSSAYIVRTIVGAGPTAPPYGTTLLEPRAQKFSGSLMGLHRASDGTVYFGDTGGCVTWALAPSGLIQRVVGGESATGCGAASNAITGFGGRATLAQFPSSSLLAGLPLPDGNVLIRTGANSSSPTGLSMLMANGTLEAVTMQSATCPGKVCPATANVYSTSPALLSSGMALGPDGRAYLVEPGTGAGARVLRYGAPELPGCPTGTCVPSEDGSVVDAFDALGRHASLLDGFKGTTLLSFAYGNDAVCPASKGPGGCITAITDAGGNVTTVTRPSATQVQIKSPFNQTTTLTLDSNGRMTSLVNPAGDTWSFAYDTGGLLTGLTKPAQNQTGASYAFTYDADGRLSTDTNPLSATVSLSRKELGESTSGSLTVTGGSSTYFTDALSRAREYRMERRGDGADVRTSTGPDGIPTIVEYRKDGTVYTKRPDSPTSSATEFVEVTEHVTPHERLGPMATHLADRTVHAQSALYGSLSRTEQVSLSFASGADVFSATSETTSVVVNPGPNASTYQTIVTPSAGGKTIVAVAPLGRQTQLLVDDKNRPLKWSVPTSTALPTIEYAYDAKKRLSEVRVKSAVAGDPDRVYRSRYDYSPDTGFLSQVDVGATPRDAGLTDGAATSFGTRAVDGGLLTNGRDAIGRIKNVSAPNLDSLDLLYDRNGNTTQITLPGLDAGRSIHGFQFDSLDLANSYQPPDVLGALGVKDTSYLYDRSRALTQIRMPWDTASFRSVTLTRDDMGRVVQAVDDSVGITSSYDYDAAQGQVLTATTSDGTTVQETVAAGLKRVSRVTAPATSVANVSYAYEAGTMRLASVSLSTVVAQRTYDAAGSLSSLDVTSNGPLVGRISAPRDNTALGRLSSVQIASCSAGACTGGTTHNISETPTYNGYGEATKVVWTQDGATQAYALTNGSGGPFVRDVLGRMSTWSETVGPSTTTGYGATYDVNGRLASWTKNGTVSSYYYDADGNRTLGTGGDALSATFDAQDRLTQQVHAGVTAGYTYNNAGTLMARTLSGGASENDAYVYDLSGALRRVDITRPAFTGTKTTVDYVVDAFGRRLGKKVNGAATQGYVYDGSRIVGMLDGTGTLKSVFVYGTKATVPELIVQPGTGHVYRVISDWRGSVRLVVDITAGTTPAVVHQMDYNAWGVMTESGTLSGAAAIHPFGFAGGLVDRDTGLVRFGARDYDPDAARWTRRDPIGFEGGFNTYAYCNDDPVNYVDPTGLLYETGPEALQAAVIDAFNHSANGNEWGGVVYEQGGKFFYTLSEQNQSGGTIADHDGSFLAFHTHPAGNSFSPQDIRSAFGTQLPMLIINTNAGSARYGFGSLYVPPAQWPAKVPFPNEKPGDRISTSRSAVLNRTSTCPPNMDVLRVPR